ncbi:MAG: prolyl oligopeptidase family serine peptidase [Roseivirga sp.]|nr:prolyl oligopeptidase family serine peptidase [Roseivirga sp.]
MNRLIALSLVIFFTTDQLNAQDKSAFEKREHTFKQGTLLYRVLYPENFDRSQKYPLVYFLHGAGERGTDNAKQLIHGSKLFLDTENRQKYPAIVVFPQCPPGDYWANVSREVNELTGKRDFIFAKKGKPTKAMKGALSLIDSLVDLTYVDNNRIYISGLSMGGMGTFELVSRRPKTFAAAMPICGGDNPKSAGIYATRLPFWVFHGARDNVVPSKFSEQMVEAIKAQGGNAKFSLYPNANHNSWDKAFAEPEFLSWLFSQSK